MKNPIKIINILQIITFIIFIIITFSTSTYAYVGLASSFIEQIFMISMIFGIEFLKSYTIILANSNLYSYNKIDNKIDNKIEKKKLRKKAINSYALYALCACISISGNLFFTLAVVDKREAIIATQDVSKIISNKENQIIRNNKSIDGYWKERDKYVNLDQVKYNGQIKRDDSLIANKDAENKTLQKEIDDLQIKKSVTVTTLKRTIYDIVSDTINVPVKLIAFIMMALASLVIELGILKSAPHFILEIENNNSNNNRNNDNKNSNRIDKVKEKEIPLPLVNKEPEFIEPIIEVQDNPSLPITTSIKDEEIHLDENKLNYRKVKKLPKEKVEDKKEKVNPKKIKIYDKFKNSMEVEDSNENEELI